MLEKEKPSCGSGISNSALEESGENMTDPTIARDVTGRGGHFSGLFQAKGEKIRPILYWLRRNNKKGLGENQSRHTERINPEGDLKHNELGGEKLDRTPGEKPMAAPSRERNKKS